MSEHGWNDPPVFAYSGLQAKPEGGKRTQLNKRVPHNLYTPSSSTQSTPKPSNSHTDCPLGPPIKTKPDEESKQTQGDAASHSSHNSASEREENVSVGLVTVETVIQGLERVVEEHKDAISDRTVTEVKTRFKMLADQWKNDQLCEEVQVQMSKLTTALEEGHYSLADELHVALMVNHVAEVGRWMVGVKKLIAVLKQQAR